MSTAERLNKYYPFDEVVVATVAETAAQQHLGEKYWQFIESNGYRGKTEIIGANGHWSELVDMRRDDEAETLVYHLPMANPIDPNQLYQMATIAAVLPNHRLIAVGNPSGLSWINGGLSFDQRRRVAHGDFAPLVAVESKYLEQSKIEKVSQVGLSYGADKAAELANYHETGSLVAIEPVIGPRSLFGLARDFGSTAKQLQRYLDASGTPEFDKARQDSISVSQYALGLTRLSNFAIARGLTDGAFLSRLKNAIVIWPEMSVTYTYGTSTELSKQPTFENSNLQVIGLEGQYHALINDIHLQAAIVMQGLRSVVAGRSGSTVSAE